MHDVVNDDNSDNREGVDPQEVCVTRNSKAGSTADAIDVENNNANDLGKSQGDYGQVITTQAQRRNAYDQACQRCDDRADQNSQQENQRMGHTVADDSTQRAFPSLSVIDGEVS